MLHHFAVRSLAVCLVAAVFSLSPQPAQARHWHGGGFGGYRGGFYGGGFRGGFYGGGYGRGYYGGYYPRYRGGFYPRVAVGFYPGYYGGFYGGYPGYYGGYNSGYYGGYAPVYSGGYSYPVNYNSGCRCVNNGVNAYTTTVAAAPAPAVRTTSVVTTNALSPSAATQFAYNLQNNPYRQQLAAPRPPVIAARQTNQDLARQSGYVNPYRTASAVKVVESPPLPGF